MTVTPSSFRADFPAFSDAGRFPDSAVNFWLGFAQKMLPADRWDDILDMGTELFVAHHLVMESASASTGSPGQIMAPMSSKSVGPLSAAYDTGTVTIENAGHWNATMYGIRFWQLAQMIGAGGLQL